MEEGQKSVHKYFFPCCYKIGCKGLLDLKFNDNFTLDFICDKNNCHRRSNIYFKTLERFYLKEKYLEICAKCSTILDNASFKYINCGKIYCIKCVLNDSHLKQNYNDISENSGLLEKCLIHDKEFSLYCEDCKKYFCFYCLINNEYKDNHSKEHKVVNLLNLIPSKNEIDNLKNKINEKKNFYEDIIDSINEWQRTMREKSNRLKQNLRDEICLLEKMIFNFNQFFLNKTYLSLFNNIKDYVNNSKKEELLHKFNNCFKIEEKTRILIELCFPNKKNSNEIFKKKISEELYYSTKGGIIEKINNENYFESDNKSLFLVYYNELKELYYNENLCPDYDEKIYSVSISPIKQQIYACLEDKRVVKIFEYDLEDNELIITDEEINAENDDETNHFNKCINIENDYLVTSDNNYIIIWKENESQNFSMIKKFDIGNKTSDLLYIDENYFLSSQPNNKTITVFDIINMKENKIITNIDSIDCCRCLLAFKDYIIINCLKGIALFFVETKEIIQYIENYKELSLEKELFLDINNNICILNKKRNGQNNEETYSVSIIKYNMIYDSLEPFEETNEIIINGKVIKIISLAHEYLLSCEDSIYSLKESEK